jgi:hypothetical protein
MFIYLLQYLACLLNPVEKLFNLSLTIRAQDSRRRQDTRVLRGEMRVRCYGQLSGHRPECRRKAPPW